MKNSDKLYLGKYAMILLVMIIGMASCRVQTSSHSDVFYEIFRGDTTMFRGTNLGDNIAVVEDHEAPNEPEHNDKLGLSYHIELDTATSMVVDYYSDNIRSEIPLNRVASVVANISLDDEVRAAQLYGEIQSYFNRTYGLYSGTYGDYSWSASTKYTPDMEVRLILDENKRNITINFIDTQPGNLADSLINGIVVDTFFPVN